MAGAQRKAVANYRRRLKRQGVVRVEVKVPKSDVALVRIVAQALSDPERARGARALLKERFTEKRELSFKEFLASAPLEGIDLTREQEFDRDVEL